MKEQAVVVSDDVHFRETGERVAATEYVTLGLDGEWRELDLTEEHMKEMASDLRRWWDAGHKVDAPKPQKKSRGPRDSERWKFFAGIRAWCDEQGRQEEYRTHEGSYYYPVALRAEFCKDTGARDPDYPDGFPVKYRETGE